MPQDHGEWLRKNVTEDMHRAIAFYVKAAKYEEAGHSAAAKIARDHAQLCVESHERFLEMLISYIRTMTMARSA